MRSILNCDRLYSVKLLSIGSSGRKLACKLAAWEPAEMLKAARDLPDCMLQLALAPPLEENCLTRSAGDRLSKSRRSVLSDSFSAVASWWAALKVAL